MTERRTNRNVNEARQRLGLRQPSAAFSTSNLRRENARGLAQSKTSRNFPAASHE